MKSAIIITLLQLCTHGSPDGMAEQETVVHCVIQWRVELHFII